MPAPPLTVNAPTLGLILSNSLLTITLPVVSNAASSPLATPTLILPFRSNTSVGPKLLRPTFPLLAILTTGVVLTGVLTSRVPD